MEKDVGKGEGGKESESERESDDDDARSEDSFRSAEEDEDGEADAPGEDGVFIESRWVEAPLVPTKPHDKQSLLTNHPSKP